MKYFLAVLAVLIVSSCAWASDPSMTLRTSFSSSNLICIPTGYTNGRIEAEATLPWKSRLGRYTNILDRVEIGLDIKQDYTGISFRGEFKAKIIDAYGAMCAIGVKNVSPEDSKWTNVIYVTATRSIWGETPFWITLGAGSGGFFRRGGEDYSGVFCGIRSLWFYSRNYNLSFLADYDGYDVNTGLEYARRNWWLQVYATDIEFRGNTSYGIKGAWRSDYSSFRSGESRQKLILVTMAGVGLSLGIPTLANEGSLTDCFANMWRNGDEWLSKSNRTRHLFAGSGIFLVSSALYGQIPLFYSGQATERDKIEAVKKWAVASAVLVSIGKELYDWRRYQTSPDGLDIFMTGAGAWLTANWSADEWVKTFLGRTRKLFRIFKKEPKKEKKEKKDENRKEDGRIYFG